MFRHEAALELMNDILRPRDGGGEHCQLLHMGNFPKVDDH